MITVLIVEDGIPLREKLSEMIAGAEGLSLLDAFSSAEEAISALPNRAPNILLMDLQLPGMSGVDCIARLAPALPATAIIVLTAFADDTLLFEALRRGAVGYLVKTEQIENLIPAIRDAAAGGSPMSPGIARRVVRHFTIPRTVRDAEIETLSARERSVLESLANGLRYKEIAAVLQLSEDTVRTYLRRVYAKLSVTSRTEAVAKFLRG